VEEETNLHSIIKCVIPEQLHVVPVFDHTCWERVKLVRRCNRCSISPTIPTHGQTNPKPTVFHRPTQFEHSSCLCCFVSKHDILFGEWVSCQDLIHRATPHMVSRTCDEVPPPPSLSLPSLHIGKVGPTFSSMSSMRASSARSTGLPSIDGKMDLGKLDPAYPTFTYWCRENSKTKAC
jgi:hypothetical protein